MTVEDEGTAQRRLILVSNRLPITTRLEDGNVVLERSSGGLASGLAGAHETNSVWIGYPGELPRLSAARQAAFDKELEALRIVPVYLNRADVKGFYEEVSNGILWPLFHYRLDQMPLYATGWDTFRRASQAFAQAVIDAYQPGDLVWVHDYHLVLVPAMIRQALPDARIGFFLHIPFPPNDVFRVLPWREEILEGLLAADLIGFHVPQYADYFRDACRVVLGAETSNDSVRLAGRQTKVAAFPLGIDNKYWADLTSQASVAERAAAIRREANGRKIFVGVDRLDYTKGLLRRFTALEMLFETDPGLAERMRLIQVVFPSRTAIATYSTLRRRIDEMVGRINGRYSSTSEAPIHLLSRNLSVEETAALYQAADVMLVTPVRDGMNLVSKEFVASRANEDGVLILSEFAGAAPYLPGAVVVNPYDIEEMAEQMRAAAQMAPAEQKARMKELRAAVASNDVTAWTESFLAALSGDAEEVTGNK